MQRASGLRVLGVALGVSTCAVAWAQADLYSKDTPADTGAEVNPDTGPMWISEDIWVRRTPDPNYSPQPFSEASPPWTPAAHQDPEYRDPKYSLPNYVYVKVRNRGRTPSAGTERLRLYWAKASTGLSWPNSWVDAVDTVCGAERALGAEITKPRTNAATATVAERQALRDAIIEAATDPAFTFLAGHSYWTKQQHVHRFSPEHDNPGFLPWHREFLNRFEVLLQEANPRLKLMYWNWTTDPAPPAGTSLFNADFMGNSGRGAGTAGLGMPLTPALDPHASDFGGAVVRDLSNGAPPAQSDATILGRPDYFDSMVPNDNFSVGLEENPNHNASHNYIGGAAGDMRLPARSTRDPFFFLLHGKVDELWARWQRANMNRIASATAYGTAAGDLVLTSPQHPWDGVANDGGPIDPWTAAGGYIVSKTSSHRSVLSPPIYDTAPLTIPALDPGQAVVLEIPWYPPNPAHYACLGDVRHYCLLSRITPGITTAEGADIYTNVRNNNNLAWKNIQVIDDAAGALPLRLVFVRNDTDEPMVAGLLFREVAARFGALFEQVAAVHIALAPELQQRWKAGGAKQRNLQPTAAKDVKRLQALHPALANNTFLTLRTRSGRLDDIELRPGEGFALNLIFELKTDYTPATNPLGFDVIQDRSLGKRRALVGGVQYRIDLSKLTLVKQSGTWRYHADPSAPPQNWTAADFDDAKWREGPAPFGFGQPTEALVGIPSSSKKHAAYFRKEFEVHDPGFLRELVLRARYDDGLAVYLNGTEVHRANLPSGALSPETMALGEVSGAKEEVFFTIPLKPQMLTSGRNVLAVEVHQSEQDEQDMIFDAELLANRADPQAETPGVQLSLREGALVRAGQAQSIEIDVAHPSGKVHEVAVFANDRLLGKGKATPYAVTWTPSVGEQRLRVVVKDANQRTTEKHVTVVGVQNIPPTARMSVRQGPRPGTLILAAEANDSDGKIREVEFFMAEADHFGAPMISVGKVSAPPYEVIIEDPRAEHRLVSVEVRDDGGEMGVASTHLHSHVGKH